MSATQFQLFGQRPPASLPRGVFSLRDYQQAADAAIDAALGKHRSTLVVAATGTGKTVLFASQARKRGGALVIAHRDSLIKQAAKKLFSETGEHIAIEKAERTAFASPYICASVQTLKGARLKDFAERFKAVKFIIVDEAHRATSKSYRDIFAAFPQAQILGVTATPDRSDKVGMGNVFESVAFRYEMDAAMTDAWLTPIKQVPVFCKANLDAVKVTGSGQKRDFDQGELDDAIAALAADNARALLDHCGNHRLIVFTPGVKTAHATAGAINQLRPGIAAAIDGKMDDHEKERAQEMHKSGEIQFLVNCAVLTEGYDDETLDGIFDSAPTKSRLRAVQKWGRATRIWPEGVGCLATAAERSAAIAASPKPWAMLYDLTCNSSMHDPIGPADVLLGRATDDERKRVKEKLRKEGGDVESTLAEIRAEMKAEAEQQAARAARLSRNRNATIGKSRTIWDMIRQSGHEAPKVLRPEDRPDPWAFSWMRKNGIPVPDGLTRKEFFRVYHTERRQTESGRAPLRACQMLARYGINGIPLSAATAVKIQNAIAKNAMQPLHPATLASLMAREPGE